MARLIINGHAAEAPENATVLEAAQTAGITIPTLCYCDGITPLTSCMMCVVKDAAAGTTLLSCATKVADGMNIITDDEEIHALRRDTLALLLAEHAGDCEGPCERACPAGLRVPQMLRCIEANDLPGAFAIAREDLLFPALLGRLCPAPCERVCHRGQYDSAVAIRSVHGCLAEAFFEEPSPPPLSATGKTVAVIGAGLAGLAATRTLAQQGYCCRLYEKEDCLCPGLRRNVPDAILDAEFAFLKTYGVEVYLSTEMAMPSTNPPQDKHAAQHQRQLPENDAVILAFKNATAPDDSRIIVAREEKMPARAVAAGKRATQQIHAMLTNTPWHGKRPFNSHLGRLADDELEAYRKNRLFQRHCEAQSNLKETTGDGAQPDCFVPRNDGCMNEQVSEAARCLHCDCLKLDTCKLRQYAEEYHAILLVPKFNLGTSRHGMHRPKIALGERSGSVLYEPGKCIKCGLCVAITSKHGILPGMAMTGRGIQSQVRPALGATLAEGLGPVADACVCACPTAALASERNRHREVRSTSLRGTSNLVERTSQ